VKQIIKFYLKKKYGADVEITDNQGRNALAYARSSNSNECVQLLIHNGCMEILNNNMVFSSTTSMTTLNRKSNTSVPLLNGGSGGGGNYDKLTFNNC
jgi:hypothetical protein